MFGPFADVGQVYYHPIQPSRLTVKIIGHKHVDALDREVESRQVAGVNMGIICRLDKLKHILHATYTTHSIILQPY